MEQLTQRDFLIVNKCVKEIYTPCPPDTFPSHILSILLKVVPSEVPLYFRVSLQSCTISTICHSLSPTHIKHIERIAHQYFYEHPLFFNYSRTGDGQAYKISDFLSECRLHQLQGLYEQFLQPLGMEDQMGIFLSLLAPKTEKRLYQNNEDEELAYIALTRSQRNFSERDQLILNLLRPHFAQAYQNAKALAQVQHDLAQLRHTLDLSGVIILRGDGQVRLMTQQAEHWLKQYFPQNHTSLAHGLPENLQRWVKHQLTVLAHEGEVPAPRPPLQLEREGKRLIIRLVVDHPGEQCLLLFEEQQLLSLSAITLELLGLSRREAEVLFWMAQGKSNKEIAQALDMSSTTAKKHLENIYQKLGVETRTAAVVCAFERLGMLKQ